MKQRPVYIQQQQQVVTPVVTAINIGKKSRPTKQSTNGRNVNSSDALEIEIQGHLDDNRADLNDLLLFNKTMASSKALGLDYEDKETKYVAYVEELNQLDEGTRDKTMLKRLILISNDLEFDISMLNAFFPQIIYRGVYMREVSENIINNIGFEDYKEEAQVAYASLISVEPHLHLDKLTDENGNTSIPAAMRAISMLNEMAKFQNIIQDCYENDKKLQTTTKKRVLIGLSLTLITMIWLAELMSNIGKGWSTMKGIMVLEIPLGVLIWSFIGSFAAILEQFYRKPVYEFGSTLKWIIIRPALGVVMGAGIYLAFTNGFNINAADREGGFMLFIAFMIGLSDTFTFGIIDKLKTTAIDSIAIQPPAPVTTIMQPMMTAAAPVVAAVQEMPQQEPMIKQGEDFSNDLPPDESFFDGNN